MSDMAAPTLDVTVLASLRDSVGGDDAFLADLVETYLDDASGQLGAIGSAIAADDAAALVRPAHTLKSASYTVGAMRLGDLARALEQHGRAGGQALDGARADAAAAQAEWPAVQEALRSWLDERA